MAVLAVGALQREPVGAADTPSPAASASILRDVAYGAHPRQRFDVHAPANPRGASTIFFVHGGGWRMGDKRQALGAKAAHWTAAGAFVVTTNYRLVPDADPVEQARDVARALAAAQREVARLGGDPDAFALSGHSAGAHLIALLAASPRMVQEAGARPWRATVLLDAGAIDVVSTLESGRGKAIFDNAFGRDPAFWRAASPMHQLQARTAPVLAICAAARVIACAENRSFAEKARGFGGRAEVLPKAMTHAQINRLVGVDAAYSREIDDFLRSAGLRLGG
jgi:acetyl esterase/lipase